MASPLITQLASAASEAEVLLADTFSFKGANYAGVLGPAPLEMALAQAGYAETAQAVLQASLAQFGASAPTNADAAARVSVNISGGREWKLVSVDNDGLHVKLGLKLVV